MKKSHREEYKQQLQQVGVSLELNPFFFVEEDSNTHS